MCISATNSFTLAGLLMPAGIYSTRRAYLEDRSYLPFALIPLMFSLQQMTEGLVWLGHHRAAYAFLFFAYLFWPSWIPFTAYWAEDPGKRKHLLSLITIGGFLFGLILFAPLLIGGEGWLTVKHANGSIKYQAARDIGMPRLILEVAYFLLVLTPYLISSRKKFKSFGVLMGLSLILSYALFHYAFISIWCLFAASVSLLVPYFVGKSVRMNFAGPGARP